MRVLIVRTPFENYQTGDVIEGGPDAARILAGQNALHVVVGDHPDTPVPDIDE